MADQGRSAGRSDADLITAILAGSPHAADELARRHYSPVFAALARQTGDPEEARDLAQDAFLDAFRALNSLRTPSAFPAWLRRIARNRAVQVFRRRAVALREVPLDAAPEVASPTPTPEQLLVRRTLVHVGRNNPAITEAPQCPCAAMRPQSQASLTAQVFTPSCTSRPVA